MADHIPFVFTPGDCRILNTFYQDSVMVRISLQGKDKTVQNLPQGPGLWVDGGVDGLHGWKPQRTDRDGKETDFYEAYDKYIERFPGYEKIGDPDYQTSAKNEIVKPFVESVLDECFRVTPQPKWVSIPQLPMVNNSSRNRINRLLAQNAADWRKTRNYTGKLILPVIFTHRKQVNLKTLRKGPLAKECYELAGAQGIWVAESSLDDQEGSGPLENRFQGLVQFHLELAKLLPPDAIRVAGPYWGMNLILWARGLIHYPAIGLGGAYQYRIPGPGPSPAKDRVALSPLRRLAVASPELKRWLSTVLTKIQKGDVAYTEFDELLRIVGQGQPLPKNQVAKFYKKWFVDLASVPHNGRALALYQDFSKAFVLGRSLPTLPAAEGTARRPERVAQQLMLNCL